MARCVSSMVPFHLPSDTFVWTSMACVLTRCCCSPRTFESSLLSCFSLSTSSLSTEDKRDSRRFSALASEVSSILARSSMMSLNSTMPPFLFLMVSSVSVILSFRNERKSPFLSSLGSSALRTAFNERMMTFKREIGKSERWSKSSSMSSVSFFVSRRSFMVWFLSLSSLSLSFRVSL